MLEGGNCGAVIASEHTLLVDAPILPSERKAWLQALAELGMQRAEILVNTDYHPEHILGNANLAPEAVWSHEAAARYIARYKMAASEQMVSMVHDLDPRRLEGLGEIEILTPTVSVVDRVTLHWDSHIVQVLALPGHTAASLGVLEVGSGIFFAGDNVVCYEPPSMAQADSKAWLTSLAKIRELAPRVLVPGIGELCDLEAIDNLERYLTDLREQVSALFAAGASRRECVEKVTLSGYFSDEHTSRARRRLREAVERVYAEVRQEQRQK